MSRLYLIDDHAVVREGLRYVLEAAGHAIVGESAAPTPALAELARLQPEIVLLDLRLGLRSGFELLAEVQRRELGVRVIVLTMSDQPRHVSEALQHGAWGYLLKGAPSTELLRAVEAVGQGHRYLCPKAAEFAANALTREAEQDSAQRLSPRERQILVLVARGASSAAIGESLHLSPKTVDTYRSRLMSKLGLPDLPSIVRWAIREGLIDVNEG